jgi:hypothetical protein
MLICNVLHNFAAREAKRMAEMLEKKPEKIW